MLEIEPGSTIDVAPWSAALPDLDTSGDNVLSAPELLEYMARLGAPPRTASALMQSLDTNADCRIDETEYAAIGPNEICSIAPSHAHIWPPSLTPSKRLCTIFVRVLACLCPGGLD
jgi:hypothetical protein